MPTGSHRGNVLWFSQRVLKEAGVTPPGPGYTMKAFEADLAKVAASGKTALCLGGKDRFTATELFENTLLGRGRHRWLVADSATTRSTGADPNCGRHLPSSARSSPAPIRNAGGLTWDQAAKKLATGQCAFLSMNDSVYGELVANRAVEGKDFGYVRVSRNLGCVPRDRGHVRRVGRRRGRRECHEVHGDDRRPEDITGVQQAEGVRADSQRRRRGIAAPLPAPGVEGAVQ